MVFEEGDRVYYTSGNYFLKESNPLKGSKYECQGIVYYTDGFITKVKWDNGCCNAYLNDDLELVTNLDKDNPNFLWPGRRKQRR